MTLYLVIPTADQPHWTVSGRAAVRSDGGAMSQGEFVERFPCKEYLSVNLALLKNQALNVPMAHKITVAS